jgi:hypothetical protein
MEAAANRPHRHVEHVGDFFVGVVVDLAEDEVGQPLAPADHREADVLLHDLGPFVEQEDIFQTMEPVLTGLFEEFSSPAEGGQGKHPRVNHNNKEDRINQERSHSTEETWVHHFGSRVIHMALIPNL